MNYPGRVFFRKRPVMDRYYLVYGIEVVPVNIFPMVVVYGQSKIASYSQEIAESLYFALVSLVHKITFSAGIKFKPNK